MKFTHISKKQVFKNDVITVFEEKLELPSLKINDKIANWLDAKEAKVKLKKDENNKTIIKTFVDIRL